MSATGPSALGARPAPGAVWVAMRARLGVVALLFALAALAWIATARQMAGMDAGPGTDLGTLSWFLGVWVVMMAAMMFPSVAPTVALHARMTRSRGIAPAVLFTSGYLLVWSAAGIVAFGLFAAGRSLAGGDLAWHAGGRWFAGAIVATAALYEFTPLKHACLDRCRSPLGFLLGNWRDGRRGALQMGVRHAAWCVGCCWALMAALFALGVMSLTWMALVAGLIALEKTLPWRRAATWICAGVLATLAVAIVAAPTAVPGLVVPDDEDGGQPAMQMMR